MLTVPPQVKIYVALQPTDMRRGFPGLSGDVQATLQRDPLSGHLFLFRNRRRDRIKILVWDGDGYWIFYKQLARGSFEFPEPPDESSTSVEIRASELSMLLDAVWENADFLKWYYEGKGQDVSIEEVGLLQPWWREVRSQFDSHFRTQLLEGLVRGANLSCPDRTGDVVEFSNKEMEVSSAGGIELLGCFRCRRRSCGCQLMEVWSLT